MVRSITRLSLATGAGLFVFVLAEPCHAYIDPGTGSVILQSTLAGIAVAVGLLRTYWYRLKAFFGTSKELTKNEIDSADLDYPQNAETSKES